jgi:hypothetical protein
MEKKVHEYCGMCSVAKGPFIGIRKLCLELLVLLLLVSINQRMLLCTVHRQHCAQCTELHTAVCCSPNHRCMKAVFILLANNEFDGRSLVTVVVKCRCS